MALTDTFVKNAKHSRSPSGDKHRDGGGMFLLVSASGKYWRMDYRFADKRKTLALGVQIVEGGHPGSSYYAAVLRQDVDYVNNIARSLGLKFRFREA